MDLPTLAEVPSGVLMVKDSLASVLREEIISGGLAPGQRIVEATWASKLGVAQASIREALNILIAEGFVEKASGRTARVTQMTDQEVVQIYQIREALERLAARIVAVKKSDLSELDQAVSDMRSAVDCGNVRAFYERDVRFHLLICKKSGNRFLEQHLRRLIVPLFAFVVMRVHGAANKPEHWRRSIEQHREIVEALRSGDPVIAEHQVAKVMQQFFTDTYDLLLKENSAPPGESSEVKKPGPAE